MGRRSAVRDARRDGKKKPRCPELSAEITFRKVLEFDGEIFHASAHFADARTEDVVEDCGRNSCCKSYCGGDQRFGDAWRNGAKL